jgi:hypothetical protein
MIIYYLIGRTFTNVVHHKQFEQLVLYNREEAFRMHDVNIGDNPAEIKEIKGDLKNLLLVPITHASVVYDGRNTEYSLVTKKGTVHITWRGETHHEKIEIESHTHLEIAPPEYRPELTWEEAKLYCFSINIDGKIGWRLPTSLEWNLLCIQDPTCDYAYLYPWINHPNMCMAYRNGSAAATPPSPLALILPSTRV